MSSSHRRHHLIALGIIALLVSASTARAQRPGFEPRAGLGPLLLSQKAVQADLKLTDEQIEQVEEFVAKHRNTFSGARDLNRAERREAFEKAQSENLATLTSILTETQQQRFKQIGYQLQGYSALANPDAASQVGISDEQRTKIAELQTTNREAMRKAFSENGNRRAALDKIQSARQSLNDQIKEVLTPDQQAKWQEMLGEPFEHKDTLRRPPNRRDRKSQPEQSNTDTPSATTTTHTADLQTSSEADTTQPKISRQHQTRPHKQRFRHKPHAAHAHQPPDFRSHRHHYHRRFVHSPASTYPHPFALAAFAQQRETRYRHHKSIGRDCEQCQIVKHRFYNRPDHFARHHRGHFSRIKSRHHAAHRNWSDRDCHANNAQRLHHRHLRSGYAVYRAPRWHKYANNRHAGACCLADSRHRHHPRGHRFAYASPARHRLHPGHARPPYHAERYARQSSHCERHCHSAHSAPTHFRHAHRHSYHHRAAQHFQLHLARYHREKCRSDAKPADFSDKRCDGRSRGKHIRGKHKSRATEPQNPTSQAPDSPHSPPSPDSDAPASPSQG